MLDLLTPRAPVDTLPWLAMSPAEMVAVLASAICVWCYTRQSLWAWPMGLLGTALFVLIFWDARLYAEVGLQVIYIMLQVYGWWYWMRGGEGRAEPPISRATPRLLAGLGLLGLGAWVAMAWLLGRHTDTDVAWWDALTTVLSLIAQWLIGRKILENWYVWIAADLLYVPLFVYKGLYLTGALYVVFLILCLVGLGTWRRTLRATVAA